MGAAIMTAKRTPIRRPARNLHTARGLYREMCALEKKCICGVLMYNARCQFCERYMEKHDDLCTALNLKWAWQFPAFVHPDDPCPYPPGTAGFIWWSEAQKNYRMLNGDAV